MNSYEQIIKLMRKQGAMNNPPAVQLGIMTGPKSCSIGELELDHDDLLIAEHLADEYKIEIDINITGHKNTAKVYAPLKEGDLVLIQRLSAEKYVIIERLVEL